MKSRTRLSDFSLSCIGEGNGNPFQYSYLENPRGRGAWWHAVIHGVSKSRTWLSNWTELNHFLYIIIFLQDMILRKGKESESEVAQLCLTLCDPMDCSLPGSSIHGILQARILEWVAISFSSGSSWPRDRTQVSRIAGRCFNLWATMAQMVKHHPAMQEIQVWSLGREDPLRRKWQPTSVILPGKFHGQRSLVGYSPWDCEESDTTERLHFREICAILQKST